MEPQEPMHLQPLLPNAPQRTPTPNEYYTEWLRLLKRSTRKRETILKFLVNLALYSTETASLVFTLLTGFIIPEDREETIAAVALYILTGFLTVAVMNSNQRLTTRQQNSTPFLKTIVLNLAFLTKPFRYFRLFSIRHSRYRVIRNEQPNIREGKFLTERSLQSLVEITVSELEDNRFDLYEVFFQLIPMTMLQTYLLFNTHQRFQLCNVKDLSRLISILAPLLHGAKALSTFEATKLDYEQSIHMLEFYRSSEEHEMVVYPEGMLSLGGLFNVTMHLFTIVHRFYAASFFLVLSPLLSLVYVFTTILLNFLFLFFSPQHLLAIHQNPPLGVSTTPSYLADRLINAFSTSGTRYPLFTNKPVIRGYRLPLALLQIPIFLTSLAITYGATTFIPITEHDDQLPQHSTTLNETLDSCPELSSIYHRHEVFKVVGDLLFSSYKSADDTLQSFTSPFQFVEMIFLLFYAHLLSIIVYAFYDLTRRTKSIKDAVEPYFIQTYPILTGYSFYNPLLRAVLALTGETRITAIRKLMVLTCLKEPEFYNAISFLFVFRKSSVSDAQVEKLADLLASRITTPDDQLDTKINACVYEAQSHEFINEFRQIREILFGRSRGSHTDKKLFLGFFAYFDRKICALTSDRIQRIFEVMGVPLRKEELLRDF